MNHYDTLKVTQDAPAEVISAAYKALALIYHPDRNINNAAEAMAKMQDINIAYKVLSDPQKRAEHDAWINSRERRASSPASDAGRRRKGDPGEKAKAEKVAAEASKWSIWAEKTTREAREAQERLEKAQADLAKAKEADRPKWETWVAKMAQEAREAQDRADKAVAQAEKATAEAVDASTQK